ncbi:MAG: hypothetical protein QXT86_14380 [Archaeoglobaceae archaeon]
MKKLVKEVANMLNREELLKVLAVFKYAKGGQESLLDRAKKHLLEDPLVFKYEPTLSFINGRVYGSCKCPYHQNTSKICKHMVAKLIYLHKEMLEEEPEWRDFMQEYKKALQRELDSKITGEIPQEFAYF